MKVLIDHPMAITERFHKEDAGHWEEIARHLDSISVHHTIRLAEDHTRITLTLFAQKIVLDEIEINQFFHDVISMFSHQIEYAHLGGAGCEFSITLSQTVDK